MTADSDRHLALFERVSPLTSSMGIAVDLGIALVISKSSSSKVKDQQVESTGYMKILDGGLAWIHPFCKKRARHFAVHLDMVHLTSTCGLSKASSSECPGLLVDAFSEATWISDLYLVNIFDNRSLCLWSRHETYGSWKQDVNSSFWDSACRPLQSRSIA